MEPVNHPLLKQLHDIHLPPPIPVWPLAPGWYVLGLFIISLLLICSYRYWRHLKKQAYRKWALRELQRIQQGYDQEPLSYLSAISTLLRRIAITAYPQQTVASLQGQAWLAFLDRTGKTNQFSQGVGKILADAPYQSQLNTALSPEFFKLVNHWIRHHYV